MRIGVDSGGTFTDCVYLQDGALRVKKVFSTPRDPSCAIVRAVEEVAAAGAPVEILHGTTVGTNTLLERTGARVVFVTTAGFEDTLEIGRQARPRLYDLLASPPAPLVPSERRFGVVERIAPDGSILVRLSARELARLVKAAAAAGPESIAISLLFSFANPAHERAIAGALQRLGVPISASHRVLPEFREYERASTVVVNAYLAPRMAGYLGGLERWAKVRAAGGAVYVMQSSGGITRAGVAAREPVRTVLSGPAGGVVGAHAVARRAGIAPIISFDMGGTSTDVSLVEDAPRITGESVMAGFPVGVAMLDIHTVGAGGGSLARIDAGGALRVGPESAGADPGPICYGRGELLTVTDANLLMGRLDPEFFLGGEMRLDLERTRRFFQQFLKRVGTGFSRSGRAGVQALAEGIVRVANASMEKAIRVISIERGHDPREFTLVSFGGAGGLHACALAAALRIPRVLVPQHPGALSALGILLSDAVKDYSRTVMLQPGDTARLARHFAELERRGQQDLAREGLLTPAGRPPRRPPCSVTRSADLRYAGQGYEFNVPWESAAQAVEAFHRAHQLRYGYSDSSRLVEIVNVRVRLTIPQPSVWAARERAQRRVGSSRAAPVMPARGCHPVFRRDRLRPGDRVPGPAVITEYSATTFLPPGFAARVDEYGNLLIADCGLRNAE
jgi:N-methylhydantoinase A